MRVSPLLEKCLCQSKREGQLRAEAARRTRSFPTAPAQSPRPLACLAASVSSGRPSLRPGSFGRHYGLASHRAWPCIVAPVTTRGRLGAGGWNGSARTAAVAARAAARCWPSPGASLSPWFLAQSPPWCVSPQLRRLGHCSWLLAELWKPPRLNAAPADVTAACDQSAPRGPSVNHSASPGPGECGETAFRGSVAAAPAAPAAPRCADGGQHRARAPSCSALHPPERLNLFTVPLALDENVGSSDSSQPWATASLFEPPDALPFSSVCFYRIVLAPPLDSFFCVPERRASLASWTEAP
ncbi:PREDICTED: uncharacterized protein LOC105583401 [Cercocebus atys]|uniref:uncharacterized protein LOC105583401 n=1 Tax=Cercocebus atys TaxID=9531 RepID=UPI0005F56FDA|nr:PREDICTED: uncharacterized protein LOC105583401 [Cercocebus atys]